MLKFSFGMPKKLTRRLEASPQVGDLQQLFTQAIEESGRDVGIAWTKNDVQFRLFVRHHAGEVLWRLFHGAGLSSQHSWSSSETNLRTLYGSLLAECNDLMHVSGTTNGDDGVVHAAPEKLAADGFLPETVIARRRGKLEEGVLEHLMQGSLPIKRTYLATSEPLTVDALIEKVGLPLTEVHVALKELLASGLLTIIESGTLSSEQSGSQTQFDFADRVRAKPNDFEKNWTKSLATPPEVLFETIAASDERLAAKGYNMTAALMQSLQILIKHYADQFNRTAVDQELHILVTDLGEILDHLPKPEGRGTFETKLMRWRASTSLWSLSVRARPGIIELFIVSAADAMTLGTAEHELQAIGKLQLVSAYGDLLWLSDGLPISPEDIRSMMRTCMRELIRSSINELLNDDHWATSSMPESVAQLHARQTALEKQNLAQKIVSQQEEIQRRIARDLHDAVIADVTLLKRSISGDASISRDQVVASLDQVTARLREICYDLSPSDLKDWGLQTTIEDLLDQVSQRTGADCSLACDIEIPTLESSVELHVFRIVQEALNNSAKYANATSIVVSVRISNGWLQFSVQDNGRGFDSAEGTGRHKDGGMGMSSMQERVELIRTLYPARLQVISQPGKGTATTLSVKVPS